MPFPEGDWDISVRRKLANGGMGPFIVIGGIMLIIGMIASCSQQLSPHTAQPTASQSPTVPRQSAPEPRTPPQPTTHFVAVGAPTMPLPSPPPVLLGRAPDGRQVFGWQGRRWFLPSPGGAYPYLCVVNGLTWCWHTPPNSQAWTCVRNGDGAKGWCWRS